MMYESVLRRSFIWYKSNRGRDKILKWMFAIFA